MKVADIKYCLILTIGLFWIFPSGCNSDDGPATEVVTQYDIVCLRTQDKTGTTFTLTKPAGGNLITYKANQLLDTTKVHVGDRCLLAYQISNGIEPYKNGQIKALGYSTINNDKLRKGSAEEITNLQHDGIYLMSAWQSEDFLNLRMMLPYTTETRLLTIVADESTLDNEYPDCYLVHQLQEPVNTFDRECYLSVDMSSLRKLESCRGFNLILKNTNLKRDLYHFDLLKY